MCVTIIFFNFGVTVFTCRFMYIGLPREKTLDALLLFLFFGQFQHIYQVFLAASLKNTSCATDEIGRHFRARMTRSHNDRH